MTKIKNFRIPLRPREIARWLKVRAKLQMTPALEATIEHAVAQAKGQLEPCAVYTTLTRSTAEKATPLPLSEPAVAASAIAVTIGTALDAEITVAAGHSDSMQEALLSALREEALGQAVQFIMRLLETQAKEEECELSAPRETTEGVLLRSLGSLLGTHRIGISLDQESPTLPSYARLVWTEWSPKARAKASSKSAERAEKAAVS